MLRGEEKETNDNFDQEKLFVECILIIRKCSDTGKSAVIK